MQMFLAEVLKQCIHGETWVSNFPGDDEAHI